jgi:AmmeMemoRadiSam system protein B
MNQEKGKVRPAVFAGQFYPAEPAKLRALVSQLLAESNAGSFTPPKAVIAPHAGYMYSGPIAASAYACFLPARAVINQVVLLGPSHHVAFDGLATTSAEAFATPLGQVRCDRELIQKVESLPAVVRFDAAHTGEHSLEVQLPFLQVVLEEFSIVPLVVGEASVEQISAVLEAIWGGPETRIVISSDLSHYYDWQTARELDADTARVIELLRPEDLGKGRACGRLPIQGLLCAARHRGLESRALDLRNSGDTSGSCSKVVGYGAFAFAER